MVLLFLPFYLIGHINTAFPTPLTKEEEQKYIAELEAGSSEARDVLIEHNLRLVAHIAGRYSGAADSDDLISIGTIGLIKAVSTYKSGKGRLSTYAAECIKNEILMELRHIKKRQGDISLQETIGVDREGNEVTLEEKIADDSRSIEETADIKMQIVKLYKALKSCLTKRERDIIEMRYGIATGEEITQREIAGSMGISRSYVSRIETKALKKLRSKME